MVLLTFQPTETIRSEFQCVPGQVTLKTNSWISMKCIHGPPLDGHPQLFVPHRGAAHQGAGEDDFNRSCSS